MSRRENDGAPRKRGWNWLKITLVLSLAFNVLIIGAVGSIAYKWKSHQNHWRGQITVFKEGRKFARTLPWDRKKQLRNIWHKQRYARHDVAIPRALDKAATQALIAVLESEPLDVKALEQAMLKIHDLFVTRFTPMQAAVGETVRALTPQERKALAARLRQALSSAK